MCALLKLSNRPVLSPDPGTKLLEDAFLARVPVSSTAIFEYPIELLLSFSAAFLDGGDEVLFVSMTEVTCNISVLKGLKRGEGGLSVEVSN